MIMVEKKKWKPDSYDSFGSAMPDGRLTEPSAENVYMLREAIRYSEQLGRPLTDIEMKKFIKK